MKKLRRLRWRFDFHKTRSSLGIWDGAGETNTTGASSVKKEGLARVCIESKCLLTNQVEVLAECKPDDYINIEWAAVGLYSTRDANGRLRPAIIGITLVSRHTKTTFYVDGSPPKIEATPSDYDKNLAEWRV